MNISSIHFYFLTTQPSKSEPFSAAQNAFTEKYGFRIDAQILGFNHAALHFPSSTGQFIIYVYFNDLEMSQCLNHYSNAIHNTHTVSKLALVDGNADNITKVLVDHIADALEMHLFSAPFADCNFYGHSLCVSDLKNGSLIRDRLAIPKVDIDEVFPATEEEFVKSCQRPPCYKLYISDIPPFSRCFIKFPEARSPSQYILRSNNGVVDVFKVSSPQNSVIDDPRYDFGILKSFFQQSLNSCNFESVVPEFKHAVNRMVFLSGSNNTKPFGNVTNDEGRVLYGKLFREILGRTSKMPSKILDSDTVRKLNNAIKCKHSPIFEHEWISNSKSFSSPDSRLTLESNPTKRPRADNMEKSAEITSMPLLEPYLEVIWPDAKRIPSPSLPNISEIQAYARILHDREGEIVSNQRFGE